MVNLYSIIISVVVVVVVVYPNTNCAPLFPASQIRSSAILFIADYSKPNGMILGGPHRNNVQAKFSERRSVVSIAEMETDVDSVNLSRAGFLPFQKPKCDYHYLTGCD